MTDPLTAEREITHEGRSIGRITFETFMRSAGSTYWAWPPDGETKAFHARERAMEHLMAREAIRQERESA